MGWITEFDVRIHGQRAYIDTRFPAEIRATKSARQARGRFLESVEAEAALLSSLYKSLRGNRRWYHRPGVSLCVAGRQWVMVQRLNEAPHVSAGKVKRPGQKPAQWYQATQKA